MLRVSTAVLAILLLAGFDWIGRIELDAEGLQSENPQTRKKAVRTLSDYDIAFTKDYLLGALDDDDGQVRAEAARALAQHKVAEAVPKIIDWLTEPDADTKKAAARVLGELGSDEAVQPLVRALGDQDPKVRLHVVVALGKIGAPAVVVPLLGRLEDDKPEVRRAAVEQLAQLGDRRAVIPLVGAFSDSSVDVRIASVKAVGRLGDKAAVPALTRLFRDPNNRVRSAAVVALGNLEAVDSADQLIEMLRRGSSTREFRAKVAYALGKIGKAGHAQSLEVLVEALAEPNLRDAAREALLVAGTDAVPALIRHLDGELDGDPTAAVMLLRDAGDPAATGALVTELERGRVNRDLVLEALGTSGDSSALVPVLSLLDDPDPSVRMNAMRALRPLLAPPAADVLIGALGDDEPDVRVLAAEYLGVIRSRAAVPRLSKTATGNGKLRLRLTAIDALGVIRDPRAADVLLEILEDGPPSLRRAAADALVQLADDDVVKPLMAIAADGPANSRSHAVRALGGVLRDASNEDVRGLLERLAAEDSLAVSLSAIAALGSMGDAAAAPALLELATDADSDRRRAAVQALGNLGAKDAVPVLTKALEVRDDRIAAAAAWALGKLGATDSIDALFRAAKRRSWATPVNATGALARLARKQDAERLTALLHHRNRFVRSNAAYGLLRLETAEARVPLSLIATRDESWLVRVAAARALGAIGGADEALAAAISGDTQAAVRDAAAAARDGEKFTPPKRTQWKDFYFVWPDDADEPVRQEPYVVVGADGLTQAIYTDVRGQWTEDRFPAGDYICAPRAEADKY